MKTFVGIADGGLKHDLLSHWTADMQIQNQHVTLNLVGVVSVSRQRNVVVLGRYPFRISIGRCGKCGVKLTASCSVTRHFFDGESTAS